MSAGLEPQEGYYFQATTRDKKLSAKTNLFIVEDYSFKCGSQWTTVACLSDGTILQRSSSDSDSERYSSCITSPYNLMRQGIDHKGIIYYEVTITYVPRNYEISIGLASAGFNIEGIQCGKTEKSFGYVSSTEVGAFIHRLNPREVEYDVKLPPFGMNDVIGVGYSYDSGSILLTLNGKFIGLPISNVAFSVTGKLHACVTSSKNCALKFNFGNAGKE
jgi:hypothetical protein